MRNGLACIVVMMSGALHVPALAETPDHDRRLAQAAAEILAARMGELRGGLGLREEPVIVAPPPPRAGGRAPAPRPGEWRDGLAIAVEGARAGLPEI